MKPLSQRFNAAVVSMASRVCPMGYDVHFDDETDTYDRLIDHVLRTGRISVNGNFSDQTIFGDPEINYAFRAWHDWTHYNLRAPFTLDGELAVAHRQIEDLCRIYGHNEDTQLWSRLIMAEIYGQALHQRDTGEFPVDQVAFDLAYINEGVKL